MALTTVTVHGQILAPVTLVPAVGTVRFSILQELNDIVDNITYAPVSFTATLDLNGEFTLVLPATDNPDLVPASWVYQVYVATNILTETIYVQLPFAPGITEFADLTPLDYNPCAGTIAATPVPADLSNLFVLRAGDTMTGNLIINANLQVAGDANIDGNTTIDYQGITGNIGEFISTVLGSGVISGGDLSPNVDPTKLDISAMTGYIVDYNSSAPITPTNPSLIRVSIPNQVALVLTGPPAQTTTWWLVNSAGTVLQQAARPTPVQRRTNIVLGATAQSGGIIFIDQTLPVILSQLPNQLVDLIDGLGPFSTSGNVVFANGVNLTVNKTVGNLFVRAFSQIPTYQNPHNATLPAQSPVTYRRATATAVLNPLETLIDVANYDPGGLGVVTPVGGGVNTSTNFRIWGFGTNLTADNIAIQYGQNTYSSLANAVAGIGSGLYIANPLFVDGTLLGWLSVIRSATDLSSVTEAVFTKAPKFSTP